MKIFMILIMFCSLSMAKFTRELLVIHPASNKQSLIKIHDSGVYGPGDNFILWDSKKEGVFPAKYKDKVGWLKKSGGVLIEDLNL